jgi:co-chaperonin GroES (HSP10)
LGTRVRQCEVTLDSEQYLIIEESEVLAIVSE